MKTSETLQNIILEIISDMAKSCEGEDILTTLIKRYCDIVKQETIEEIKKQTEE